MNEYTYPCAAGHDLAYVSQNHADPLWKSVCKCGWKSAWLELEGWALVDHKQHADPIYYPLPVAA